MHVQFRNVNDAFRVLVGLFANPKLIRVEPSRNGNVRVLNEPVLITYTCPKERVLFNAARDANPFFHLYEALWMLAGRNDVAPLNYYNSKIKDYSDDGVIFNGAYGYRWRKAARCIYSQSRGSDLYQNDVDQLDVIVKHLKNNPTSRRVVLQIWNVEDDLLKIGGNRCGPCGGIGSWEAATGVRIPCVTCDGTGISKGSKDCCCNLSVMFSIRSETDRSTHGYEQEHRYLDITVTNRSNDCIWGLLGTNYVHFTILQEYMAAKIGVEIGRYHHFSNNLHVYDWNWKPKEWLEEYEGGGIQPYYLGYSYNHFPLVKDPAQFEIELPLFVEEHSSPKPDQPQILWKEPFFEEVADPMLKVFHSRKDKRYDPPEKWLDDIMADDWRIAAEGWVKRRIKK